jgi:hypothetical protein
VSTTLSPLPARVIVRVPDPFTPAHQGLKESKELKQPEKVRRRDIPIIRTTSFTLTLRRLFIGAFLIIISLSYIYFISEVVPKCQILEHALVSLLIEYIPNLRKVNEFFGQCGALAFLLKKGIYYNMDKGG